MAETIVLVYKPEQVPQVRRLRASLAGTAEIIVVALDAEAAWVLETSDIPFRSLREYAQHTYECHVRADEWCDAYLRNRLRFFAYRGADLADIHSEMFQLYLEKALYYVDALSGIHAAHPTCAQFISFDSGVVASKTSALFAQREANVIPDMVRAVARAKGIVARIEATEIPRTPLVARARRAGFAFLHSCFEFVLGIANFLIGHLRRPRAVRVLASDYWWHIAPLMQELGDAEVVLLDRSYVFAAGWRTIWNRRMRFYHLDDFVSRNGQANACSAAHGFALEWEKARASIEEEQISFEGISMNQIVCSALDLIIGSAVRAVEQIEGAYSLYERLSPTVVILRASISAQLHFGIMSYVARAMHIPSLELQHGLEYLGPGSTTKHHAAECLAVYGPYIRAEIEAAGSPPARFVDAGSPRFDTYAVPSSTSDTVRRIICLVPNVTIGLQYDTFDIVDFIEGAAAACAREPGAEIIVKMRPGPTRDRFLHELIRRAFSGQRYTVEQYRPLENVLETADLSIMCYSTAVLEAMLLGVPVILYARNPIERRMVDDHFGPYARTGALGIAHSAAELAQRVKDAVGNAGIRKGLRDQALAFLKENYSFDGHASERIAAYIREGSLPH